VGDWTLEAADVLRAVEPELPIDILEGVASLVDQSLVQRTTAAGPGPRFLMLETIREFALEQLMASGEEESVSRAHATYFVGLAEQAEVGWRGPDQQHWRDSLGLELENARAAVEWASRESGDPKDTQLALRLTAALWYFWMSNFPGEGRRWVLQALAAAPAIANFARGWALHAAGVLAWRQGDYSAARRDVDESIEILRETGNVRAVAEATHTLGHIQFERGDYAEATALFEAGRARFEELGDIPNAIPVVGDLGMVAYHQGDYPRARAMIEESLVLCKRYGLTDHTAHALNRLGDLARISGDFERAGSLYEESLDLWRESGGKAGIASALHKLGQVKRREGKPVEAGGLLRESLVLQRQLGNKQGIAECLAALGGLSQSPAGPHKSARMLGAANKLLGQIGAPLAPADRIELERALESARAALGAAAWEKEWEEGHRLTLDDAVAEALANDLDRSETTGSPDSKSERLPLSARELEVAGLIARGMSNREVAAALTITVKTAANHVDHILTKLDLHTRTQIAVWAVQHGLSS
jgi:ATP/maltotriose-dependent transcriptional regulator MalT